MGNGKHLSALSRWLGDRAALDRTGWMVDDGATERGVEAAGGDAETAFVSGTEGGTEDVVDVASRQSGDPDNGRPGDKAGAPAELTAAALGQFLVIVEQIEFVHDEDDALFRL